MKIKKKKTNKKYIFLSIIDFFTSNGYIRTYTNMTRIRDCTTGNIRILAAV